MEIDPNLATQGGIGVTLAIAVIYLLRDAVNRADKNFEKLAAILGELRDELRGLRSDMRAEADWNAADHERILEELHGGNVTPIRGVRVSGGAYGAARSAHPRARGGDATPIPGRPPEPSDSPSDGPATDPARRRLR